MLQFGKIKHLETTPIHTKTNFGTYTFCLITKVRSESKPLKQTWQFTQNKFQPEGEFIYF